VREARRLRESRAREQAALSAGSQRKHAAAAAWRRSHRKAQPTLSKAAHERTKESGSGTEARPFRAKCACSAEQEGQASTHEACAAAGAHLFGALLLGRGGGDDGATKRLRGRRPSGSQAGAALGRCGEHRDRRQLAQYSRARIPRKLVGNPPRARPPARRIETHSLVASRRASRSSPALRKPLPSDVSPWLRCPTHAVERCAASACHVERAASRCRGAARRREALCQPSLLHGGHAQGGASEAARSP